MDDISNTDQKGEAALAELRIAYADAMWSWASVEGELFAVYFTALKAYQIAVAPIQRSYFQIVSAQTRLQVTHTAATTAWGHPRLATWMKLSERCREELRVRGNIAHLQGEIIRPDKPHQKTIAALVQHQWHPNKGFNPTYGELKSRGIDASQLREMKDRWSVLSRDLSKFVWAIWKAELNLPGSPPPASAPQADAQDPPSAPPLPPT